MSSSHPYFTIGEKLQKIFLRSIGIVFVLVTIAFFLDKLVLYKKVVEDSLFAYAKIIGENCSAAILFGDEKTANEILGSLKNIPDIVEGRIFLRNGQIFVQYLKLGEYPDSFSEDVFTFDTSWSARHFSLVYPIFQSTDMIGTVFLKYDFSNILWHLFFELLFATLFLGILIFLAYLLFSRFQKTVSEPIMDLVRTMDRITREKNYALRVSETGEGEVAILATGFNGMLNKIELWDQELGAHRKILEAEVAKRTAQLQDLNQKMVRELVQRKHTESELRIKTKELENASEGLHRALEAEKRFLASVSHEIRNPLNVILGSLEILMQAPIDAAQMKLVGSAHGSSVFLLSLINDILDVSKIDAGQMELNLEEFELRDVLMECLDLVHGRIKKNVNLQYEIPNCSDVVIGDSTRIKQIFFNLLGNSAKFTQEGYIKLYLVESDEIDSVSIRYKFCVEDTGIGISEKKIQIIGTPFRQAHSSHFGGSGLGIYLTKAIAKMMKGDLEIQSQEGYGTKVFVWFSMGKAPERKPAMGEATPVAPRDFGNLRVLLVEDDEMNLMIVTGILSTFFSISSVETAINGVEALERLKTNTYDIIFMDIQMPVMDGITATKKIRKSGIAIPIIALSANAFLTEIEKAKDAGMNDYITKPIKSDRILEVFKKYC